MDEKDEGDDALPPTEHAVAKALRKALPTIRHADLVFDMVLHELGEEALVYASPSGTTRWLFRRIGAGSPVVIPWPILTISFEPQRVIEGFWGDLPTVEAPHRPEVAPNLRGLKPGHVVVHDGPNSMQVTYREDGLWKETTRSGRSGALHALRESIEGSEGAPPERVADFVLANNAGRHGPGRLLLPTPLPGGPAGAWSRGLQALRVALHRRTLSPEPGWLVADGFDGRACVRADTEEDALAAWREAIEARQPHPPRPVEGTPPPEPEPWASDSWKEEPPKPPEQPAEIPWPEARPENTPAVVLPIEECPLAEHEWGTWMRALGPHGESAYALQRFGPDGFTLVGQDVVEYIDFERLDAALAAVDATTPKWPTREGEEWKGERVPHASSAVSYRVVPQEAGSPSALSFNHSQSSESFEARILLDGSRLRDRVFRQRWG